MVWKVLEEMTAGIVLQVCKLDHIRFKCYFWTLNEFIIWMLETNTVDTIYLLLYYSGSLIVWNLIRWIKKICCKVHNTNVKINKNTYVRRVICNETLVIKISSGFGLDSKTSWVQISLLKNLYKTYFLCYHLDIADFTERKLTQRLFVTCCLLLPVSSCLPTHLPCRC